MFIIKLGIRETVMLRTLTSRILALLTAALLVESASAQLLSLTAVRDGRVEAELIAEHTAVVPGETARVGLRLKMDEGWHTYWKNPGDSGMATSIEWQLPEGVTAEDIDWPAPHYYEVGGLASYGYEGEIVLPVVIHVPADFKGERVRLRASADWLVCKEACEPGAANLFLNLLITEAGGAEINTQAKQLFAWADSRTGMAVISEDGEAEVTATGDTYRLRLPSPEFQGFAAQGGDVRFFPEDPKPIAMSATQVVEFSRDEELTLLLERNPTAAEPVDRLAGVLAWHNPEDMNDTRFFRVDLPVRNVAQSQ
ncbi:protein-disulfide reductase DsbD domain-containing protein [Algisphaera agarilytica]|uniref:DsbC/DsbD-like thiol-disulfide interchange protein n=1 Tax=Algisphaera agarilytica TaxID=1385975 RepID=A0A7X0H7S8_9BACT|nr:protein-disulfide reductase DsbD domain-containing protein [Algisphaera agarilytica]MBB6430865.1 DsbC/DsbD-like thiol-disulfide interchange protein [Algisphaera agarilytica]